MQHFSAGNRDMDGTKVAPAFLFGITDASLDHGFASLYNVL